MANTKKAESAGNASDKWKLAAKRAQRTATWAKTLTKKLIAESNGKQPRWHVVNFLGPRKSECRGIVDLIAIRKNHQDADHPLKKGDLFEVIILQVKGGSAKWPSADERERLRLVGEAYKAKAILLSEWKQGAKPRLYRLIGDEWGERPIDALDVFSPRGAKQLVATSESLSVAQSAFASEAATARSMAAKKAWVTRRAGST